ncbi:MAG: alpha/beta fold hydrolase [Dehalococcoidia bacterium]|nr:MAG: alpha/beta fold hydrolase [Dehalococcoidia bacterium]
MSLTKLGSSLITTLLVVIVLTGCDEAVTETFFEEEVSFQTEDSSIAGTLAVPDGEGPFPAAIILVGSGPFDCNGDVDAAAIEAAKAAGVPVIAVSSTYRDIAYGLSEEGIITLRYDKRGIGNSTGEKGDYPQSSTRDLTAAIAFLKEHPSVDRERVALVGHSIGGLWALRAAAEDPEIAALCLMATPAQPFSEVIVEQIEGLLTLQGANETYIASVVSQQRALYDQIRSGALDLTTVPEPMRSELEFLTAIMDVAGADYAGEIDSPVLILQGDKDLFTVIPEEAQLLNDAFIAGGNEAVELIVFPDLDHMFRPTPGQPGLDLYYQDRGPIPSAVVETIVDWMVSTIG